MSYEYGIFQGDQYLPNSEILTTFRPNDVITQQELVATLMRLVTNEFYDPKDKTTIVWSQPYDELLAKYTTYPARDTSRYNVFILMYDLYKNNVYRKKEI